MSICAFAKPVPASCWLRSGQLLHCPDDNRNHDSLIRHFAHKSGLGFVSYPFRLNGALRLHYQYTISCCECVAYPLTPVPYLVGLTDHTLGSAARARVPKPKRRAGCGQRVARHE